MEKIKFKDYIKQIRKNSGHAEWVITEVMTSAAAVLRENLDDGKATTVFKGMVIEPHTINNGKVTYARARFGTFFKDLNSAIL